MISLQLKAIVLNKNAETGLVRHWRLQKNAGNINLYRLLETIQYVL